MAAAKTKVSIYHELHEMLLSQIDKWTADFCVVKYFVFDLRRILYSQFYKMTAVKTNSGL